MKTFSYLLYLLLLTFPLVVQAGTKIVGHAVDKATGAPIRGVNVRIEGTFYGTVTDAEGMFTISTSAPPPYLLVFERSPYTPVKMSVKEKFDDLQVELLNPQAATQPRADAVADEYAVKLALIEKLLAEITWEQGNAAPFAVGVLGYNPFGDNIFALESKKIMGQPVKILFVDEAAEMTGLDLLFVATTRANKKLYADIASALQPLPILTVADEAGALDDEAMLSFSKPDGSLAIHLNEKAAKTAGISFSARLKAMAQ